jgi:hypothetical protein
MDWQGSRPRLRAIIIDWQHESNNDTAQGPMSDRAVKGQYQERNVYHQHYQLPWTSSCTNFFPQNLHTHKKLNDDEIDGIRKILTEGIPRESERIQRRLQSNPIRSDPAKKLIKESKNS